jgi:peptidyl-prolyl cis-trans isomerase SurA
MRSCTQIVLLLVAIVVLPDAYAGELLDKVLVTVNSRVILSSDLESEVQFQKLMTGTLDLPITAPEREAALQRLIDRRLVEQQMSGASLLSSSDPKIAEHIVELRKNLKDADTDEGWRKLLAAAAITEQELAERVAEEVNTNLYVGEKFQPSVRVNNARIRNYYQQTFTPEVRRRGGTPPPLEEVSGKIEQILTEQTINELFSEWVKGLRTQARVRVLDSSLKLSGFDAPPSLEGMNFLPLRISPPGAGGSAAPAPQ